MGFRLRRAAAAVRLLYACVCVRRTVIVSRVAIAASVASVASVVTVALVHVHISWGKLLDHSLMQVAKCRWQGTGRSISSFLPKLMFNWLPIQTKDNNRGRNFGNRTVPRIRHSLKSHQCNARTQHDQSLAHQVRERRELELAAEASTPSVVLNFNDYHGHSRESDDNPANRGPPCSETPLPRTYNGYISGFQGGGVAWLYT